MYCSYCGGKAPNSARFCAACGRAFGASSHTPTAAPNHDSSYEFASFWPRFGAFLIDAIAASILAVIAGVAVAVLFGAITSSGQEPPLTTAQEIENQAAIDDAFFGGFYLGYLAVYFLYQWISTALGGGIGKRITGIRVVDEHTLTAPGYGKAFGRVLVSIASRLVLYVGYLWPIWDAKKRTWHDMASGTLVVRADSIARAEPLRNERLAA